MGKQLFIKPYRTLALVAGILLVTFLLLEGWLYYKKTFTLSQTERYQNSLTEAVQIFNTRHDQLLHDSSELAKQLETQLQLGAGRQRLYQSIQQYPSFWGTTLFQNSTPLVWDGFAFTSYPRQQLPTLRHEEKPYITVLKQNNVIALLCSIPFIVEDSTKSTSYELLTTTRIEQQNALPIGKSHEFDLLKANDQNLQYPVQLSFFESLPDSILGYRVLSTISNDSVGVAFAPQGQKIDTAQQWNKEAWFWRSAFATFSFFVFSLILYLWLGTLKNGWSFFLQLLIIAGAWLFFKEFSIPARWISNEGETAFINLAKISIFIFVVAETIARFFSSIDQTFDKSKFLRTIFLAGFYGLLSAVTIALCISQSYNQLINLNGEFFDLKIFPSLLTAGLYLCLSLIVFSVGYALYSIGYFLLRTEQEPYKLIVTFSAFSFILSLTILQLYLPEEVTLNWAFWIAIASFGLILSIITIRYRYPDVISSFSLLRGIALISFTISLFGFPILQHVHSAKTDRELLQKAQSFLEENGEDPLARQITQNMLTSLKNRFTGITQEDLQEHVPQIQSTFTQTIEQSINLEWRNYSLNLQLIKPSGELIADYSTDLNAPNWTSVYDLTYLSAATDIERITKETNRPIIQQPELKNSANYDTFYRGWIPIFGEGENQQIAWILCSVYREYPNFDKPIRAVLASLTYSDWEDSYLFLEYKDGNLLRTKKQGLAGQFPRYYKLQQAEIQALSRDSVVYFMNSEYQKTYRNILYRSTDNRVVKASTIYPNTKNILFGFFRYSFTLLLGALLIVPAYMAIVLRKIKLQKASKRLEHRILDTFLISTLLFLGLLVVATNFAIKEQNKKIVQEELLDKLEGLADATQTNQQFMNAIQAHSAPALESLVSPLNVDASYYQNNLLTKSTTPQIYQQNMLPSILPFDQYDALYIRKKRQTTGTVELASQNLLIGYRSLLSSDNEPIAAVAIPTFLQSPKYDQQLLETTSYLIVFYLFIFGLFILAITLLSKRLTQPLRSVQAGLNKISEGNLNTTIPVTSEDEIGSLAKAYNGMVDRLKQVRKELAIAEREAAWKEMAQQVAHEIKNPLTPMKLNVQHLQRQISIGNQNPEELKSYIKRITKNLTEQIETLNNIASDFSKFSKPISKNRSRVNVNNIIESVSDLYREDNHIKVKTSLTEYPIYIDGISDELRRVFINLVKNSFEAMPEEGGTIILKSFIQNGSAFFEIEDNGTGISEDDKSKIFVPNFSTKSSGTGLGLAICKKIIEAHDGSITFASIDGEGTTFIIKMPLNKN